MSMFQSKAFKKGWTGRRLGIKPNRDKKVSLLRKIITAIDDFWKDWIYYPIDGFYNRYTERIGRSFAFAVIGWLNYDFDSGFLFDLMSFKLKRVHKCLIEGVAVQEKEPMDALKEAIKICDRLHKERYDDKYFKIHFKKWGTLRSKHIPCKWDEKGKPTLYQWKTWHPKANTPRKEKQERKEFRALMEQAVQDRLNDLDRLNEIFKKYERTWWD